ncbi:MAG: nucleotidyltransferase substrate binding protein [Gemmataceae bacterium]
MRRETLLRVTGSSEPCYHFLARKTRNPPDMNATPQPTLNLEPLARAVDSLRDALAQPKNPYTRDASIQRFEYTFELCWKMLRRYLAAEAAVETFNLKDIFREAGRQGILADVEVWFTYLKGRNLTSHTYNEKTAEETYLIAAAFLPDAQALLDELRKRTGGGSRTD